MQRAFARAIAVIAARSVAETTVPAAAAMIALVVAVRTLRRVAAPTARSAVKLADRQTPPAVEAAVSRVHRSSLVAATVLVMADATNDARVVVMGAVQLVARAIAAVGVTVAAKTDTAMVVAVRSVDRAALLAVAAGPVAAAAATSVAIVDAALDANPVAR